jgi:hypothetical protein
MHVTSLSSYLMLQIYGDMGLHEEETGYQCDKVELQAYESKEDK